MDNHKCVYRVHCEEGLNLRSKRPKRSQCASHRQPVLANASNLHECWSLVPKAFGIVTDQLYDGSHFRALTVVDNYSLKCLDIYAGKSLKGSDVVGIMDNLVTGSRVYP